MSCAWVRYLLPGLFLGLVWTTYCARPVWMNTDTVIKCRGLRGDGLKDESVPCGVYLMWG